MHHLNGFFSPPSLGFPLLLKASAGGGGKGMRVVRDETQLLDAIDSGQFIILEVLREDLIPYARQPSARRETPLVMILS